MTLTMTMAMIMEIAKNGGNDMLLFRRSANYGCQAPEDSAKAVAAMPEKKPLLRPRSKSPRLRSEGKSPQLRSEGKIPQPQPQLRSERQSRTATATAVITNRNRNRNCGNHLSLSRPLGTVARHPFGSIHGRLCCILISMAATAGNN